MPPPPRRPSRRWTKEDRRGPATRAVLQRQALLRYGSDPHPARHLTGELTAESQHNDAFRIPYSGSCEAVTQEPASQPRDHLAVPSYKYKRVHRQQHAGINILQVVRRLLTDPIRNENDAPWNWILGDRT